MSNGKMRVKVGLSGAVSSRVAQMGWEQRGSQQYYYKKEREGSRVKSVYIGRGEIAHMVSQIQSTSPLLERVARSLRSPDQIKFEKAEAMVQAILDGKRPSATLRRRDLHPDFPLRHFVLCGACSRPLTASWSKGRSKAYAYYHCANGSCKSRNIPKQLLEGEFLKLIEQLQPKPEYLRLFREIVLDVWTQRQADTIRLTTTLQSRLDSLKAKRQRVIDAFLHERSIDKQRTRIKLIC